MKKNENISYDYSNYYYKSTPTKVVKRGIRKKISAIFFVVCLIVVVSFFSFAFSNFLTVGKIVNIDSNYITNGKTLYAISLYSAQSLTEAQNKSDLLKPLGAAGYIYNYNLMDYKILGSLYSKKSDAVTVNNNLINSGENSEIIEIEFLPINLKLNLTSKNAEVFNSGINLFYNNYLRLYDLSNAFDKQEIDVLKLKSSVKELIESNSKVVDNFNKVFSASSNISVLYTKIYLNRINKYLKDFLSLDDSANFSSSIKETYFNIVFTYLNMQKDML